MNFGLTFHLDLQPFRRVNSQKVKSFLQRWIITTLAVMVASYVVEGIHAPNFLTLVAASLVLGILNAILRPVMLLLSLPLVIVTLGLFTLVINAGLLYLAGALVKGFEVDGFWAAFLGALIISIVTIILNIMTGTTAKKKQQSPPAAPKPPQPPAGQGPIIDV